MLHFLNDYEELGHPKVLETLTKNWGKYFPGYGYDEITESVNNKIKNLVGDKNASIHFIAGGTLTNLLACSAFLYPYESIIAIDSAHIQNLEAGAIEATGHKILTYPNVNGKITVDIIEKALKENQTETKSKPGLVFLANASEKGTIYTKQELTDISNICRENDLILFMDGARLGFALASDNTDLTLTDIAELTDVFYIGGTKNGAIYGEALVITNPSLQKYFINAMKNRGALLAKGYASAMQFDALMNNNVGDETQSFVETLYFSNAKHANNIAKELTKLFIDYNLELSNEVQSNQVFVNLPNDLIAKLRKDITFEVHDKGEVTSKCRFVCTFANNNNDIEKFKILLDEYFQ